MSDHTSIEWTATRINGRILPGYTFNPHEGCQKVGPGCDHCYAEARNVRFTGGINWGPHAPRRRTSAANWRKPLKWNAEAEADGIVRHVFCASIADVFDNHPSIEDQERRDLGALVEATPWLIWFFLTKRIGNAKKYLAMMFPRGLPKNVWIGATIVNREEMLRDGPKLMACAAPIRFWSVEPMLGDLGEIPRELMPEWIIVGGESGHGARPMNPQWARDIRDQCLAAGTAFFFKQNGEWVSVSEVEGPGEHFKFPDGRTVRRTGKKLAGRTLDGRTWDQMPGVA